MMNAEVVTIGDELLIGQVINTNQAFVADRLNMIGIRVIRMATVGDNEEEILSVLEMAWKSADIVLVTGGLGPTHDDVTRAAICTFFNTGLVRNEQALENIRRLFASRGLPVTPLNEQQAFVPQGCAVIPNSQGTAPGYLFEKGGKSMIILPGVPYEMKAMMEEFVIPHFQPKMKGSALLHRTLRTTGIAESHLAEKIGDTRELFSADSGLTLAFLPSPLGVRLRISARDDSSDEAARKIADVERKLRERVQKYIYGVENEDLEAVVGEMLAERGLSIAVAESCTGGLLSDRLTNVPGSSRYFLQGFVVYSNASKVANLELPESLLKEHGAVSMQTAEAMAEGVRKRAKTDIGISTTGIAGPSGGSAEKPVGLVWIAYSDKEKTFALKFHFGNNRRRFKERASQAALELMRRKLLKID